MKKQYEQTSGDFIGDQRIDRMTEDSIWTPILLVTLIMVVAVSIKFAGLKPFAYLLIGMAVSGIVGYIDMYLCSNNYKKHVAKDVPPEQPVGFSRDLLDRHDKDVCEKALDYINEGLSNKKEGRP